MIKKKKPFNKETQKYILEIKRLNPETDKFKIDRIFETHIYEPFKFISLGLIMKYKYYESISDMTIDQLLMQTVSWLFSKIEKYDDTKGVAFSYFSVIAKNYLTQLSYKYVKQRKQSIELDSLEHVNGFIYNSQSGNEYNKIFDIISKKQLYDEVFRLFMNNLTEVIINNKIFIKEREKNIIKYAMDFLQKNNDGEYYMELINKKFLFYYIQDNTDESRYYIYKVIDKLTIIYNKVKNGILLKYHHRTEYLI